MRLYLDACDTDYIPVAPVLTVSSASVARMLDGAGSIRLAVPLQDDNARTLLTAERRFILYGTESDGRTRVELTRGIIRTFKDSEDGTRDIDAMDALDEFRRRTTGLGRRWDGGSLGTSSLSVVVNALVNIVGGWAVTTPTAWASELRADRFDGATVLKALNALMTKRGSHLRLGSGRSIEFGDFGAAALPRLIGGMHLAAYEATLNDEEAWIEGMTVETSADDLCTRIIPVGGGEGEAALNLRYSTRTTPYTIQTMVIDGKTNRYLVDTAAEALYGVHEKVLKFDITPIANSAPALQIADDALYDAAVAYLIRHKDPLTTYSVTLRKCETVPLPGDKLRLRYQGYTTDRLKRKRTWLDVDAEVWVMKVNQRVSTSGRTVSLTLASIDRRQQDIAEVLVGAIETVELRGLKPVTFPSYVTGYGRDGIQGNATPSSKDYKEARYLIRFDANVTELVNCRLRLQTKLPSTSMFVGVVSPAGLQGTVQAPGGAGSQVILAGNLSAQFWYYEARNYKYLEGLRLYINGVDVTSAKGGPWGSSSSATTIDVDITDDLLNAVGGFRQTHTVVVTASETFTDTAAQGMVFGANFAGTARVCGEIEFNHTALVVSQAIITT